MKTRKLAESLEEQERFDGEFTPEDRKLYELLFDELNEEPTIEIPSTFADEVAGKMIRKATVWEDIKLYGFMSALFLTLVAVCVAFFGFDSTASGQQTQSFLMNNIPFIIIATLTYFVVQTLDRVLVKNR